MKVKLCVALAAALVAVPAAFAGSTSGTGSSAVGKAASGTTINVYASGDVNVQALWQNNLIPYFEKANKGIYVHLIFSEHGTDDGTTLARIGAAVKARHWPGIDLVDGGLVTTLAGAGLDQPVSKATAPNLKRVSKALLTPVKGAAIPYRGSSVVLAYDSSHVSSPPKTLAALLAWIKSNPGKFTYNSPNSGGSGYAFAETVLDSTIPAAVQTKMVNGYDTSLESNWKAGFDTLKSLNKYVYQRRVPERERRGAQPARQGSDLGGAGVVGSGAQRAEDRPARPEHQARRRSRARRSRAARHISPCRRRRGTRRCSTSSSTTSCRRRRSR